MTKKNSAVTKSGFFRGRARSPDEKMTVVLS